MKKKYFKMYLIWCKGLFIKEVRLRRVGRCMTKHEIGWLGAERGSRQKWYTDVSLSEWKEGTWSQHFSDFIKLDLHYLIILLCDRIHDCHQHYSLGYIVLQTWTFFQSEFEHYNYGFLYKTYLMSDLIILRNLLNDWLYYW